ncbi:hypothetical protein ACFQLX_12820 [Streptomyces polyrhachis]|uniref:Integral membrane protein n=1 Tax=Streptomyces polyrhachis TaxID=1282885 RepID=A0ABW2GE40_9ACTN
MMTTVRLWRWRRNALKRRSDVLEAWAVLLTALFALVGGVLLGVAAGSGVQHQLLRQREGRQPVRAVLAADPRAAHATSSDVPQGHRPATVSWRADDGRRLTATARVPRELKAGDTALLWTDPTGTRILPAPPTRSDAALQGTFAGVATAAAITAVCWLLRRWAAHRLDRHRLDTWAYEWARVGPHWRREHGLM